MNLLCIYPWLALGGADKFNLDMVACLQQRGWRVTIVTTLPSDHAWRTAFAPFCETIVDLTLYPTSEWPARLLALSYGSDALLVSHSMAGYHLLPYLRAHLPRMGCVDYCHMLDPAWLDGGYPRISMRHSQYLDMQIVSSQQLKGWMISEGGRADQIEVCTTNVDTDDWNAERYDQEGLRYRLGIGANAPVILYAGRLTRQKQPRLAAEVMRRVVARYPEAVFLVAGDGEYRPWMERFVDRYELGQGVRILGAVDNQRMRELFALSDLFFLPSENEGISLAVYEAMAMGVVPVTADVGGQRELVTPETGVLVRRSSMEGDDYTAALLRLLGDVGAMQEMGRAARQRVRADFSLDAMGERMHRLLLDARERRLREPRSSVTAAQALASAQRAVAAATTDLATSDRRWRARLRPERIWSAIVRRLHKDG